MLRKTWLSAVTALVVTVTGITVTSAPAATAQAAAPTTITVPASDDTYVSQTSPDADHATFTWMSAFNGAGNERFGLVRFKVAGIPEGAEVKATLELHSVRTTDTALAVRRTTSDWDEHVLYSNRPTLGATAGTRTGFTAGVQAKIDLSSAVNADGVYAFALTSTGGVQGVFHSSRATATGAISPRLVITYTAANTPPPAPAGPLPFNLPAISTLRASAKKVFAHYFTPYPISLDNQPGTSDYYARNYLTPTGESGKHAAYGGLLRDRPLPRAAKTGDWQLADMETEIRLARAAGLDGFTVDVLSLTSQHWTRLKLLVQAAKNVDPGFKIVLMPDMNGLKVEAAQLADSMAELAKSSTVHRLADDRLVISPFKAENKSVDWWKQFMDIMRTKHGVKVAFVPVFLNFSTHAKAYAPISYGFSNWGNRSPAQQSGIAANIKLAHDLGKIWMQPVSVQDERPNQGIYDEANNTENLRVTWDKAISGGADWVQLTTWNDFSEGTQFTPSTHNGGAYLDITSYYLTKYKTGKAPAIVRDTLYLTHRLQKAAQRPSAGTQTKFMAPRGGTSTPRDTVEVLAFLTGAASLQASIGGAVKKADLTAGLSATTFPLAYGKQSASVVRSGKTTAKVVSPFEVKTDLPNQDLQYVAASSGRQS